MPSKSFYVNQCQGSARMGRGGPQAFLLQAQTEADCPLDTLIQRKSTLNLNMNMKIEDVHLFP